MAEFVRQHYGKEGQVLNYVPDDGTVSALPSLYLEESDEEPRPVKKNVDSFEPEEMNRALAGAEHAVSLPDISSCIPAAQDFGQKRWDCRWAVAGQ